MNRTYISPFDIHILYNLFRGGDSCPQLKLTTVPYQAASCLPPPAYCLPPTSPQYSYLEPMEQTPRIETLSEKQLIGQHIRMSMDNNRTGELWRSFMPRRKEILNPIGSELFSLEIFEPGYFENFSQGKEFEKWAAVEVSHHGQLPEGMESLIIPEGLYAVFIHRGPASEGPKTYQYIYNTWLPQSTYQLADRPHFAIMGEKYKHDDPDSEEEVWVPVKERV